jgi:hypothetical protein
MVLRPTDTDIADDLYDAWQDALSAAESMRSSAHGTSEDCDSLNEMACTAWLALIFYVDRHGFAGSPWDPRA